MHTSRTEHLCVVPVFAKICTEMHASRAALFSAVRVFSHKCFENHASRAALFFEARVFTQKCSEMRTSRAPGLSESLLPLPEQHRTRWNLIFNTINLSVTNFVRRVTTHRLCKTGLWFYLVRYAYCAGDTSNRCLLIQ